MAPPKTFAVIGAGVAGLQAAAQLKQAGYDVTIFEKSGNVGGVWQSNYAGYRLQVRKWHYEIPGYNWTDKLSEADPRYPSGQEVQSYLERYAQDAGLLPLTRFNVNVHSVRPVSDGAGAGAVATPGAAGWEVEWDDSRGAKSSQRFDYLVVATGLFNEPDRPDWAEGRVSEKPPPSGPWVVDAKAFTDASVARGKRVVVVGGGKTAVDVGVATSKVAASATLVARRGHVMAPRQVLGFIPFEFASYTRWSWALQPAWYAAGPLKKGTHTLFRPIKAAAWGLFGLIFPLQTSTPGPLKPRHGLLQGIYDTIGIVDSGELSTAFKSGKLATKAARVRSLTDSGVELDDGTKLQADIVVLATGYRATARSLLPQQLQAAAGYKGDNQWLYRNVLPQGLSNFAYIGQNATFQHVLTTALQSRWLVDVLQGKIKLPPPDERAADVAAQEAWLARFDGVSRNNNHVWAQHGKYHDALARDIAGRTYVHNPLAYVKNQAFAPLFPGNASLLKAGGAKARAAAKPPSAGIPVSATQATAAATA